MSKINGYIEIRGGVFGDTSKDLADSILAQQDKNRYDIVYGWAKNNDRVMIKIKDRQGLVQDSKPITGLDAVNILNGILLNYDGGYLRVIYTDDSEGIIAEWTQEG